MAPMAIMGLRGQSVWRLGLSEVGNVRDSGEHELEDTEHDSGDLGAADRGLLKDTLEAKVP